LKRRRTMGGKRVGMTISSILFALTLTGLLLVVMAVEAGNGDSSKAGPDVVPGLGDAIGRDAAAMGRRRASGARIAAQPSLSPSLLIDDFHDEDPTNEIGGDSGWGTNLTATITCSYPGGMLCCSYAISPTEDTYAVYWTELLSTSLAGHNSLSFQVKGDVEGELVHVEFRDCHKPNAHCPKLEVEDYTAEPITSAWQKVMMPLVGFTEITDWNCSDTFSMRLDNPGGDGRGTICLDNIWLEPTWVPVVVDGFNDCQDPNALKGATSVFAGGMGTIGYGYTDTVRRGDVGCAQWITYAIPSSDSYAVWQTELKGLDVSEYEALAFRIKGSQGGEEPNVWLDSWGPRVAYTDFTVTATGDDWQRVVIPLSHFSTRGVTLSNLAVFQLGFEWTPMTGTVYLDDVQFIPHNIYLPIVLKNYRTWDAYYEDNDQCSAAYGPLASGQIYWAYPDDANDYYYFELSAPATVNVSVTDFAPTSTWGDLLLYGPTTGDECGGLIGQWGKPGYSAMSLGPYSLGAGKYHVRIYTVNNHYAPTQSYSLLVTYELGGRR
jgi:hypothetical protein